MGRRKRSEIEATRREVRNDRALGIPRCRTIERLNIAASEYDWQRNEIAKEDKKAVTQSMNAGRTGLVRVKPFWIWSDEHAKVLNGSCCFNHLAGLPEKNGQPFPLFDYEKTIIDELEARDDGRKDKHLWLKKATGLGISELMLRYMAWLCYRDDTYSGAQMCIVTGPNISLAKGLIRRMKGICRAVDPGLSVKGTVLVANGCWIEAFPSHHLDAMRSLPNPKFILIDEADFFPKREQQNARDISERYIAKSDPYIVMVSTPNLPGGLYESIEKERDEKCIYRRLKLDYRAGLGKIYTDEEIQKAKESPAFEREYNLRYGFGSGKIFSDPLVTRCEEEYPLELQPHSNRVLAVDPAFSSSKFGIVGVEQIGEKLYVKEAKQFDRPSFMGMLDLISMLAERYPVVLIDGAFPGMRDDLMLRGVDAISVNFRTELPKMVVATVEAINQKLVKVHPVFSDLLHQLRSVTTNSRGNPDKTKLSYDLGDCLMMAVYHLRKDDGLYIAKI